MRHAGMASLLWGRRHAMTGTRWTETGAAGAAVLWKQDGRVQGRHAGAAIARKCVGTGCGRHRRDVTTGTQMERTGALRPARWSAGTTARGRHRTRARRYAGTECLRGRRHAMTGTRWMVTAATGRALYWRQGGSARMCPVWAVFVRKYVVTGCIQGQNLVTTVTRTQMMDARALARLNVVICC